MPTEELPTDHRGNSLESDRSLGLTRCVFFGWGLAEKRYGKYILCFSSDILELEGTFVTPTDIGQIAFADEKPFSNFRPDERARVETEYFDLMVSGRDWQEIIARRILRHIEGGTDLIPLHSSYSLGEIKHTGAIPKRYFRCSFPTSDLPSYYRFLYEHGFSFANMEDQRRLSEKMGQKMGVDPTYEECGIDYESVSQFWKRTLGIK